MGQSDLLPPINFMSKKIDNITRRVELLEIQSLQDAYLLKNITNNLLTNGKMLNKTIDSFGVNFKQINYTLNALLKNFNLIFKNGKLIKNIKKSAGKTNRS